MFTVERFDSLGQFGYEQITTAYEDLSIAEKFGSKAILETYDNLVKNFTSNYKYMTELVMVLNWKIWRWYEQDNTFARLYNMLWEQAEELCFDTFNDDEMEYYFQTTD